MVWCSDLLLLFLSFVILFFSSKTFYDTSNGGDIQAVFNQEMAAGMTCLVLAKGKYTYSGGHTIVWHNRPIKICGQGIGETILDGFGLKIQGSKSNGTVVIQDLSIQEGTFVGLQANNGMDLIVRRCKVEKFQNCGVVAYNAHISCDDVQVIDCGNCGVLTQGSTVKLSSENTRIEGNMTSGDSQFYGLTAYDSSSKIQIVTPLTKDTISINNGGGGNWGGPGTIEQVDSDGVVLQTWSRNY